MNQGLLAVAAIALLGVTQAQPPVFIGLVREDGYLLPIAIVTSKLFEKPPETLVNDVPLPPEEPDLPFTNREWTLSSGSGKAPVQIKTLEWLVVDSGCGNQPMWRTTLKLPPAREHVLPVRKIGIAVSGGAVEHPEDVTHQPDAASRQVARRIVHLAHAKEAERLKEIPKEYLPEGAGADRSKVAVQLRLLRRHPVAGMRVYYFEATKAWGLARDNGLVTGWIVDSGSALKDYGVTYKFNDDSAKENDHANVWGVVRYQDKALWILEWHGYESEYYTVHDWPSGVERLTIGGWSC